MIKTKMQSDCLSPDDYQNIMPIVIAESFSAFKYYDFSAFKYYDFKPVVKKCGYTEMGFNPAKGLKQDIQALEFEQSN